MFSKVEQGKEVKSKHFKKQNTETVKSINSFPSQNNENDIFIENQQVNL